MKSHKWGRGGKSTYKIVNIAPTFILVFVVELSQLGIICACEPTVSANIKTLSPNAEGVKEQKNSKYVGFESD